MFTAKANSKQKCMKNTQEHEKGYVATTHRGELEASKHCSLSRIARRGEQEASKHCSLSGSATFSPKNPIFINLNPKTDRKLNL